MKLLRLYLSSLRLLIRTAVASLLLIALLLVLAFSMASRAYAREQLIVAANSSVLPCNELIEMGVAPDDCARVQLAQAQSTDSLQAIADRIVPEAAALTTVNGNLAFVAGHGLSVAGVTLAVIVAVMTFAAERRLGTAEVRDSCNSRFAIQMSRVAAATTVWGGWLLLSFLVVYLGRGMVPSDLIIDVSPRGQLTSSWSVGAKIAGGVATVASAVSVALTVASRLQVRPAVMSLGSASIVTGVFVAGGALPSWLTPTGTLMASVPLGSEFTFLDHLPFLRSDASIGGISAGLMVVGWTAFAFVILALSTREMSA